MVFNPRSEIWKYFDNIVEEGIAVCKLCKQRLKNQRSYSLRKHINILHNSNAELWKYFLNSVEDGLAECKICNKRIRNNRHFNLLLHLKNHNIQLEDENASSSVSPTIKKTATVKQPIDGLYILMEKKTLIKSVLSLMIVDQVSPQTFSSKNMQALLNPICDAISRENGEKFAINESQSVQAIQSVAHCIRNNFLNHFHWRLLTLRIDLDANKYWNTFCVRVQFVNDSNIETRTIGIINMEGRSHLFMANILTILRHSNIEPKQIVSAHWDNTNIHSTQSFSNIEYLEQIVKYEKIPDILVGDVRLKRYIGVIAQLCVLDLLKSPLILKSFLECRTIVMYINEASNEFSEKLKKNKLKFPQLDSPWQWGSTYNMMNDMKNAFEVLDNFKYSPRGKPEAHFHLNEKLKNFIEAYCKAVKFLQKCLVKFHDSEMICGDFYREWLKCKLLTEKLHAAYSPEDPVLEVISSQLLKNIEARTEELLNEGHFKACLYLDPRFQRSLSLAEKRCALEYLNQLWQKAKSYNLIPSLPEPEENKTDLSSLEKNDADDDHDEILNKFLSKRVRASDAIGIHQKLEELKLPFQKVGTNVLEYWKELKCSEPDIYILAAMCFAIPATHNYNNITCTTQQTFVCNKTASPTSPIVQEDVSFLRSNHKYLSRALELLELFQEDANNPED